MEHALRRYRAKRGLSLEALGKEAGASRSTLSRIETGEKDPSVALIRRLCKATKGKVKPNDFFKQT